MAKKPAGTPKSGAGRAKCLQDGGFGDHSILLSGGESWVVTMPPGDCSVPLSIEAAEKLMCRGFEKK